MSFKNGLEKILINLGKNNKPTLVAMGVATAKGIFRPIFTMSDKKQDKDTKKYAAFREGLTELIAIPIYWLSGKTGSVLANKLGKPKDMSKDAFQKILKSDGANLGKEAKNIQKNVFKMTTNLSMLGVFASALFIIPAVCSATIKPIMKLVQPEKQNNVNVSKPITYNPQLKQQNTFQSLNSFPVVKNSGMKVGAV